MTRILFTLILLFTQFKVLAVEPLVDTRWLAENLTNDKLLIVDLRPQNYFEYAHIKGSSHTDYNLWRQPKNAILQKELPTKVQLEKLLSEMGATPEHHILLVASGESATDLASATRIYWTLEQIGHNRKSILDGGIIAYASARLPLERGPKTVKPTQYRIASMKQDQIGANDIFTNKKINLIDTRSKAEHLGIYQGAPDERAGTIPESTSLPYDWFTQNGSGRFADKNNLQTLVSSLKLDPNLSNVVYCHTGHRASLSWFVIHEILGNDNTILYDGSTREWATNAELPITQKISITH